MPQNAFCQPNSDAMERLLRAHRCDPTGVVLRLAWLEGLTRDEIAGLTWEQVDLDGSRLRLPKREVPLDRDAAAALGQWRTLHEGESAYVAISEKYKKPLAPESISRLARLALDAEGLTDVRLLDLRYDYVLRQLREHDWPYALRVSGLSVTTYRNCLARYVAAEKPSEPPPGAEEEEFRLWQVLQAQKETPAGLALWLSSQVGLSGGEIVALTWDWIDWEANRIALPDREAPLTQAVGRLLREEYGRRAPDDDPHVLLTPRTRKPLTAARLSTLVRTALIRGGIEDLSLSDFRRDAALEEEKRRLARYARANGSIARGEAMELLGVTESVAYSRLLALTEDGDLVRINSKYYPAERVIRPEQQPEAIRAYIAETGPAYCADIARLLHIGKRPASRILKRMVEAGELSLLRRTKRYVLPPNDPLARSATAK